MFGGSWQPGNTCISSTGLSSKTRYSLSPWPCRCRHRHNRLTSLSARPGMRAKPEISKFQRLPIWHDFQRNNSWCCRHVVVHIGHQISLLSVSCFNMMILPPIYWFTTKKRQFITNHDKDSPGHRLLHRDEKNAPARCGSKTKRLGAVVLCRLNQMVIICKKKKLCRSDGNLRYMRKKWTEKDDLKHRFGECWTCLGEAPTPSRSCQLWLSPDLPLLFLWLVVVHSLKTALNHRKKVVSWIDHPSFATRWSFNKQWNDDSGSHKVSVSQTFWFSQYTDEHLNLIQRKSVTAKLQVKLPSTRYDQTAWTTIPQTPKLSFVIKIFLICLLDLLKSLSDGLSNGKIYIWKKKKNTLNKRRMSSCRPKWFWPAESQAKEWHAPAATPGVHVWNISEAYPKTQNAEIWLLGT